MLFVIEIMLEITKGRVKIDYPSTTTFILLVFVLFTFGYIARGDSVNEDIKNILISIIAGLILYYFTIHIREKREERKGKILVARPLTSIVGLHISSIHNFILRPLSLDEGDYRLTYNNELRRADLYPVKILENLIDNPKLRQKTETKDAKYVRGRTLRGNSPIERFMGVTTAMVYDNLQYLKPYYYLLDHDLIKILYDIENSEYMIQTGEHYIFCDSSISHINKKSFIKHYENIILLRKKLDELEINESLFKF